MDHNKFQQLCNLVWAVGCIQLVFMIILARMIGKLSGRIDRLGG